MTDLPTLSPRLPRTDGRVQDTLLSLRTGVRSAASLQESLWRLAEGLAREPRSRGILLLDRVKLSPGRLAAELRSAEAILRADVWRRMSVVSDPRGDRSGLPRDVDPAIRSELERLAASRGPSARGGPHRGHARFAVLHVLLDQWLRGAGPLHVTELMDRVGCSYPTVAAALTELRGHTRRHGDRRVELTDLPVAAWSRYLSVQEEVRSTQRFVDRSGAPRSAEALRVRLAGLGRSDLAVGGVSGALHHVPSLDIVGTPTLCVTLHDPDDDASLDFVARLDPALAPAQDAREPAVLVVHRQRMRGSLGASGEGDPAWADPVECLLDLYEAGLEGLAESLLDARPLRRGAAP